jgi:hypothetical protein
MNQPSQFVIPSDLSAEALAKEEVEGSLELRLGTHELDTNFSGIGNCDHGLRG